MAHVSLWFEAGEESLSVRRFTTREAISDLFAVTVWARSPSPDIDLESLVGKPAALWVEDGWFSALPNGGRRWAGVCRQIELVQAEPTGLSTYQMSLVPTLWLLSQRRNLRTFLRMSVPDIVSRLLEEWQIVPEWRADRESYPKLEYKVQYDETDLAFVARLLSEAGIAYLFEDTEEGESKLVLTDAPQGADPRPRPPIPYVDNPNEAPGTEMVTKVRIAREVRPGALLLRDHDFRNPALTVEANATPASAEARYEQYRYQPGSFLALVDKGGGTPNADDKGFARHDMRTGTERAERLLEATRTGRRLVSFTGNAVDLRPGVVLAIAGHPSSEIAETESLLVTETLGEGQVDGTWAIACRSVFTSEAYRPPPILEKPRISGVQSAVVVGPPGQEIHTDEHGRVRVQLPWDRLGRLDDTSSPWIRVAQGWAGTGFGISALPRVGQEVLVGYLEGDPEQPMIVGRVFNARNVVPYRLPDHKTVSTFRSSSSPGGSAGYNELVFEDAKGKELVGIRAERDLRKLVKRDETSTVGRHRSALVVGNETETTNGNQTTFVGGDRRRLVRGDETERTEGNLRVHVTKDRDVRVSEKQREQVNQDSHLVVKGSRKVRVDKGVSLTVQGDRFEKVGGVYAVHAGEELHVKAGGALVIEAQDLTLKGPGGFIRIDAGGVTIKGTLVKINSPGGSPADGSGAKPEDPEAAEDAVVEAPEMDDVSRTGHGPVELP